MSKILRRACASPPVTSANKALKSAYEITDKGLYLYLYVTPKAKKQQISGFIERNEGRLYLAVKLRSPPEDGKANEELILLLAKNLPCKKSAISLIEGSKSRYKKLLIITEQSNELIMRLNELANSQFC